MNRLLTTAVIAAVGLGLASGVGCEEKKPDSATKTVTDKAKDAASKAGDATKAAADKTAEAAKQAADAVKAEANKWMTDVVDKQWPEAKKTLDAAGAKLGELKDAATKTKAETMFNDLKAQVPTIDELIGKVKSGTGDMKALYTDAKVKFDAFMAKLPDLKSLVGLK